MSPPFRNISPQVTEFLNHTVCSIMGEIGEFWLSWWTHRWVTDYTESLQQRRSQEALWSPLLRKIRHVILSWRSYHHTPFESWSQLSYLDRGWLDSTTIPAKQNLIRLDMRKATHESGDFHEVLPNKYPPYWNAANSYNIHKHLPPLGQVFF